MSNEIDQEKLKSLAKELAKDIKTEQDLTIAHLISPADTIQAFN